jgi:hypothetical protein
VTLRETLEQTAASYLSEIVSASKDMTEAACVAGVNRTSFHRLCARYGVGTSKQRPQRTTAHDVMRLLGGLRKGAYANSDQ